MVAQESTQAKTSGRAWLMLVVIFLLSVAVPIIWFSLPPLATTIQGIGAPINGAPRVPAFDEMIANPATKGVLFGNLMSMLSVFALISAICTSPLVKRFGVKVVLVAGGLLVTIGACVSALSGESYNVMLASRCITGLGVGFVAVSSPTAISLWFSDKQRAFAIAIWGTWVPVGMLISTNAIANPMLAGMAPAAQRTEFHNIFWVMAVIALICTILVLVIYRNPKKEEATEVSAEAVPFRKIVPYIKQHQFIMLCIAWLAFNYINYCFTTYNVQFFQDGFGMDRNDASMWGSIASALGICAPIFGFISDRINKNRKFLLISLGMLFLTLTGVFGFRPEIFGLSGTALFWVYMIFQFLGNAILVATVRPYVPLLVGKGGLTAVAFGLSMITFLQYGGQMFTGPVFGGIHDAVVAAGGTTLEGWTQAANMAIIPVGIVAFVCTFFIKPGLIKPETTGSGQPEAGKPANNAPQGTPEVAATE